MSAPQTPAADGTAPGDASTPPPAAEGPTTATAEPLPPLRPRRRWRARLPRWTRSRRAFLAAAASWWASSGADEIRLAWHDARRAPGWIVLGMIAVFWPVSGWSLMPVGVGFVATLVVGFFTRRIYFRSTRKWVRRGARPLIGVLVLLTLALEAGPWAWLLAVGLWLIFAGVTDQFRARQRILAWLLSRVAEAARIEREALEVDRVQWDGRRIVYAEVTYGGAIRAEEQSVRDRVEQAVAWALRHHGTYRVEWPAGPAVFELRADPDLPRSIYEQDWGDLPGIPVGATDAESAHGIVDTVDSESGEILSSIPVVMVDPANAERHYMVIGGTGAGKTVWIRGFIARALRMGWFPGGVFIFDGKGGSDYIVFENRVGVHCVARHPDEWQQWIPRVSAMMRGRYDEDAEYERGNRDKPDMPRYLVIIDEIQEIREVLGEAEFDPFVQQVSRQMRASNGRMMVCTQRPDAGESMPGAVRDMLEDRFVLGYVSSDGARMAFGKDWRRAVDEYGAETVPGRGVARIGGKFLRLQGFNLDSPRRNPAAERFYPPKKDEAGAEETPSWQSATTTTWAPTAAPTPPAEQPEAAAEPTEDDELAQEVGQAAAGPQTGAQSPRGGGGQGRRRPPRSV